MDVLPKELLLWLALEVGPAGASSLSWMTDNPLLPFAVKGAEGEEADTARKHWRKLDGIVHEFGFKEGEAGVVVNGRVSPFLCPG